MRSKTVVQRNDPECYILFGDLIIALYFMDLPIYYDLSYVTSTHDYKIQETLRRTQSDRPGNDFLAFTKNYLFHSKWKQNHYTICA